MHKIIWLFLIICLVSCNKDNILEDDDPNMSQDCGVMNPIGFSASPLDNAVLLEFSSNGHWDGPFLSCSPESFDLYMSEDGEGFTRIAQVKESSGSYLVDNLENGAIFYFKVIAIHSQLDPTVSEVRKVKVGLVPLPSFMNNPLSTNFEIFTLGPDGDKFLYRNTSDNWYLSSISNPSFTRLVVDDSFLAKWNPHNDDEIAFRKKQYVQVSENTKGVTSKSLNTVNLSDDTENILHEISDYMDFGSEFKPEQYWIHEFEYSNDETSIYFKSNKDNNSSSLKEKKVFNNIWRLYLDSKEIQRVSDFLPINFEMKSFVEDPNSPNNFYILGGNYGEMVDIPGANFNIDKIDVYYYNSSDQSLEIILETNYEEKFLDINPLGTKLLISNASSGKNELWSYDIISKNMSQITQSNTYRPNRQSYFPNWISDNEFIVSLVHEDKLKLAIFKI